MRLISWPGDSPIRSARRFADSIGPAIRLASRFTYAPGRDPQPLRD
jgi:hypothetical protein